MRNSPVIFYIAMFLVSRPALIAQPNPQANPSPRYVEGELLVKFAGGPRGAMAEQTRGRMQHEVRRHFDFIGWQHIRLPHGMTVKEGLVRYRTLPGVEAVEPNGIEALIEPTPVALGFQPAGEVEATVPDDPMFPRQWALTKIGAPRAWAVTTGSSNVIVAVLSTGANFNHKDLRDNLWRNPGEIPGNRVDDDLNGYVDDVHGIDTVDNDSNPSDLGVFYPGLGQIYHGTMNAGIVGAVGNNGLGIAGVAWSVQLMALRFFSTELFVASDIIEALNYIHLMKGRGANIRVVHLAYFATADFSAFSSQAMREAHERIADLDILQVAVAQPASVDHDISPVFPAAFGLPGMVSVTASDQNDNLAASSGFGRNSMELAAPGVEVLALSGASPDSYFTYTGTDAPGAFVAGAAALLFAAAPAATADDVKTALLETVDVLPGLADKVASSGRLNVGKAVSHPRIVSKGLRFTSIRRLGDGSTRLVLAAPGSVVVRIQTSENLARWTPLAELAVDRQKEFTDTGVPLNRQRFYRAELLSP